MEIKRMEGESEEDFTKRLLADNTGQGSVQGETSEAGQTSETAETTAPLEGIAPPTEEIPTPRPVTEAGKTGNGPASYEKILEGRNDSPGEVSEIPESNGRKVSFEEYKQLNAEGKIAPRGEGGPVMTTEGELLDVEKV